MPKTSKYNKEKTERLMAEAYNWYKQGLTLRAVANIMDRSHEWVRKAVNYSERKLAENTTCPQEGVDKDCQ